MADSGTVDSLARQLAERIGGSLVDLRLIHGRWCVMLSFARSLTGVVPGTCGDTPEESLRLAIERWDGRSPERPFYNWGDQDG